MENSTVAIPVTVPIFINFSQDRLSLIIDDLKDKLTANLKSNGADINTICPVTFLRDPSNQYLNILRLTTDEKEKITVMFDSFQLFKTNYDNTLNELPLIKKKLESFAPTLIKMQNILKDSIDNSLEISMTKIKNEHDLFIRLPYIIDHIKKINHISANVTFILTNEKPLTLKGNMKGSTFINGLYINITQDACLNKIKHSKETTKPVSNQVKEKNKETSTDDKIKELEKTIDD